MPANPILELPLLFSKAQNMCDVALLLPDYCGNRWALWTGYCFPIYCMKTQYI